MVGMDYGVLFSLELGGNACPGAVYDPIEMVAVTALPFFFF